MDDIRVYFHGRPQGQSIWGVKDGDIAGSYLEQFLNWTYGKDLPACMIIDHWNGDTYYSYIHRKDISEKSGRQDAYCAITLRFVHNECYNVATLYELLKAAYEQLAGKAVHIDKGFETFLITKFSDIQGHLFGISETVLVNFKSFDKLKNSIFPLRETKNTNDKVVSYALQEVDSPAFREDAKQNRILVSEFIIPKMNFLKGQVDKLKTEKENLQTQLVNISDKIANQYDEQLRGKDEEIEQLKQELEYERNKKSYDYERKKKFDLSNIKDINQIIETARQMASRFPEENQESGEESTPSKHKDSSFAIPEVWYRWIVLVFLILLLVCSVVLLVNINRNGGNYPKQDNLTEQTDTEKITEDSLTIHIYPIPVDNKLIVNTQYKLSLSDEDLECKLYYEDNQGEHLLDNKVLCPKTPNSHIKIKAVVDNDTVAISEFYTIIFGSSNEEMSKQKEKSSEGSTVKITKNAKVYKDKNNKTIRNPNDKVEKDKHVASDKDETKKSVKNNEQDETPSPQP